jgi:hypothetical protein
MRLSDHRANPRRRAILFGLAAAAVVLLAVGYFSVRSVTTTKSDLREDVAASFVQTHDGCCKYKDHHFLKGVAPNDFTAIGKTLAVSLNVPVISIPVSGWQFEGAGKCPVWGHPSGHLLYRRGDQTLSIFTISASDMGIKPGDRSFDATVKGHYLSGFIRGNGMYCVLVYAPDGSLTAGDARQLRDHLRDGFTSDSYVAADPPHDVVAAGN